MGVFTSDFAHNSFFVIVVLELRAQLAPSFGKMNSWSHLIAAAEVERTKDLCNEHAERELYTAAVAMHKVAKTLAPSNYKGVTAFAIGMAKSDMEELK